MLLFNFTRLAQAWKSLCSQLLVAKVGVFWQAFIFSLFGLEESSGTTGDATQLEAPKT